MSNLNDGDLKKEHTDPDQIHDNSNLDPEGMNLLKNNNDDDQDTQNSKTDRLGLREDEDPDFGKLEQYIKSIMPLNKAGKRFELCEATNLNIVGDHHQTPLRGSDIENWGIGIGLYYAFLKMTVKWYLIMIAFSIVQLVIFYQVWDKTKTNDISEDPSEYVKQGQVIFSLGGFSMNQNKFFEFALDTDNVTTTASCKRGTFTDSSDYMYYGLIENDDQAINLFRTIDKTCNDDTYFNSMIATAGCVGASSCTLTWTTSWFETTCLSSMTSTHKAYLKMYCSGAEIPFPLQPYPKNTEVPIWVCSLVVVVISAFILLVFFFYMRSQSIQETKALDYFTMNKSFATDYTVEISGFNEHANSDTVKCEMFTHIKDVLKTGGFDNPIIDIQVAQSQKKFLLQKQQYEQQIKASNVIKRFKQKKYIEIISMKDLTPEVIIEKCNIIDDPKKKKSALTLSKRFKENFTKLEQVKHKLDELQLQKELVLSIFITFSTMAERDYIMRELSSSPCAFYCLNCCGAKKTDPRLFNKKIIRSYKPSEPENIYWENMQYGPKNRCVRKCISYFIYIIMYAVPIIIIIFLQSEQTRTDGKATIECVVGLTQAEAITDFDLGTSALGQAPCYCAEDFAGRLNEEFVTTTKGTIKLCQNILYDKAYTAGMGALLGIILAFISVAFDQIFRLLNLIEKNVDRNYEVSNRIIKLFFWKFFNSGILIIFVANRSEFFGKKVGSFDDFTPAWFEEIGYSTQITLVMQIFVLFVVTFIKIMIPKFFQCRDRGCRFSRKRKDGTINTKKESQSQLEDLYTGAEFEIDVSYAEALKTLYISFILAPMMPLTLVMGLGYFVILYFKDKVLMLLVLRRPPNLGVMLNSYSRQILVIAPILYCVSAIWVFGQKSLLEETSSLQIPITQISGSIPFISGLEYFFTKFASYHSLFFVLIFVCMLTFYILKLLLWEWLAAIIKCCSKKKVSSEKQHSGAHFYDHVTNTQMINELALYKSKPLACCNDPSNPLNDTMQEIKKVHADRLTKYQLLIKQDLGSKVNNQKVTNIGMSIYSNDKNVFVGQISFDYRMFKTYKKYFYHTITADEAINVNVLDDSGMIQTKEIGIFESKGDKNENFFSGDNIVIGNNQPGDDKKVEESKAVNSNQSRKSWEKAVVEQEKVPAKPIEEAQDEERHVGTDNQGQSQSLKPKRMTEGDMPDEPEF